jgi:rubrerythrin
MINQIKVYYCWRCEYDFKGTKNECPKCKKKGKWIGRESFYTYGHNLPK